MLDKDINKNIEKIKNDYNNSCDLSFKDINILKKRVSLVYLSSICDNNLIDNFLLKNINKLSKNIKSYKNIITCFFNTTPSINMKSVNTFDEIYKSLGDGFVVILFEDYDTSIIVEAKKDLSRGIQQPVIEQAISGPKDSFNEDYMSNIGLIRKRIKTNNLIVQEKIIGKETETKVSICYMKNIIETTLLDEVIKKLDNIDTDGIIDSTYIKEYLESKNSVFTLINITERPDVSVMNLLNGKIILIVENSPFALIIPTFFYELFNASEDYYQKSKNVTFTRIIRYLSFFIAIILPGFYIAITTFNHETIPDTLLINFAMQREGVPFPAFVEALGMSLVFEILRESDIRMPNLSGSAISILGAIVLGDAAVSAGVVSPIMVIIIAISAICSLMFSGPVMTNGIRFWRLIFMISSTIIGLPGIAFCGFLFIITMSGLKSFGKPYLYPFAPFDLKLALKTIFKKEQKDNKRRIPYLTNINIKRSK